MSLWKCISSGNLLTLPDDFHIVEEMTRNKSYERVTDMSVFETRPVEVEKKKGRPSGHPNPD